MPDFNTRVTVSIVGGSGYTGGELLRLLLFHPGVQVQQVTSDQHVRKFVFRVHPNLRKLTHLRFSSLERLEPCDLLFLCLPHGEAMRRIEEFLEIAPRLIDLSADFRLDDPVGYEKWYNVRHPAPELLSQFVYGIPELHRDAMREARYISSAGCNATAVILALLPLFRQGVALPGQTVIEVKAGTSQGGNRINPCSHHPERSNAIRAYKPVGHRHIAEMMQELSIDSNLSLHFSATSIGMVRGIHCVAHVFLNRDMDEKETWNLYRHVYGSEPFVRIVNDRDGIHRLPDPKILVGSNYCDIGFARDPHSRRLVVYSALDNLVKGGAGQAVQSMNLMTGQDETSGLTFPGLHPV